jgi:hypothetical protein
MPRVSHAWQGEITLVYLIGVEHSVHVIPLNGNETPPHRLYRAALEKAIQDFRVEVVAEEFSLDALQIRSLAIQHELFTKKIADKLGAEHLLCDTPNSVKYKTLGCQGIDGWRDQLFEWDLKSNFVTTEVLARALDIVRDHPLREEYWYEQIRQRLNENLIFVCGDYHVDTFGKRLGTKAVQSTVVVREIGVEQPLLDEMSAVRDYIDQHEQEVQDIYRNLLTLNCETIPSPYPF